MATYLLNASVYRGGGEFDDTATVVIDGGKIKSVGQAAPPKGVKTADFSLLRAAYQEWYDGPVTPLPKAGHPAKRPSAPSLGEIAIDCGGLRLYPGLIDPHTHVSVFEDGAGPVAAHGNEMTDPNTAQLDIRDSIYPHDLAIADAQRAGITVCCILPGSGNLIGGMVCIVKLYGRTVDEMMLVERHALKMALGENPYRAYGAKGKAPSTRFGNAGEVRAAFDEALHYAAKHDAWHKKSAADKAKEPFQRNRKLENIAGAIRGEYPVRYHAHRTDDIYTALRLSREFGFCLILEHGTEGFKIANVIAEAGVPVTVGPVLTSRVKYELRERTTALAGELYRAGVQIAIQTDHPVLPIQTLPLAAAVAVKDGLPEEAAVDCMTLNAAKILGIDKRTGSLEKGKDADLFLADGDVLDPRHHVLATLIDGFCVYGG